MRAFKSVGARENEGGFAEWKARAGGQQFWGGGFCRVPAVSSRRHHTRGRCRAPLLTLMGFSVNGVPGPAPQRALESSPRQSSCAGIPQEFLPALHWPAARSTVQQTVAVPQLFWTLVRSPAGLAPFQGKPGLFLPRSRREVGCRRTEQAKYWYPGDTSSDSPPTSKNSKRDWNVQAQGSSFLPGNAWHVTVCRTCFIELKGKPAS